ncbi:MAG TPA: BlaI/MecI/CopY family transcriptional regulator [Planctomycetaceae bacterium]|jgi:predicted transcriptional regulator|nr:BlaI/MecI/CopY family transcriptional regulator [Planctomycetaceae bacterium]
MSRSTHDVTDAELMVLQQLWEKGPSTIRQLTDILYPERTTAQYATVQKLLERLEGKGCVVRDRGGPVHQFSAALNRDDLIGRRLRDMADRLCEGSLTPLLTHLVRAQRLSAEERQMLRELVGDLEPKRTRKK